MIREGESEYECSTCILFFLLLEIYTRLNVLIRYCHLNVYESNKSQKSKCTVLCSNTFTVTHSEQFTFYQMCCWEWESRPESFQVHDSKGWISIQQFDVFCFVFFFHANHFKVEQLCCQRIQNGWDVWVWRHIHTIPFDRMVSSIHQSQRGHTDHLSYHR